MTTQPKTYVLIGSNQDGLVEDYLLHKNAIIIRPQKGETIEQVAKKILPPANIILHCHGNDKKRFLWHLGSNISYNRFFRALPQTGIHSITVCSCYGGLSLKPEILSTVPAGCIVQAVIGSETPGVSTMNKKFANECIGVTNPIDLFITALDNFNPARYKDFIESQNKIPGINYVDDSNKALPHVLGIGGRPPVIINLASEARNLAGKVDGLVMARTVSRVQRLFNTDSYRTKVGEDGKKIPAHSVDGSLGRAAEIILDREILVVASKISQGSPITTIEDRRIAYAITAAYLDESGQLAKMIQSRPGYKGLASFNAAGNTLIVPPELPTQALPDPSKTERRVMRSYDPALKKIEYVTPETLNQSPITPEEKMYLESVARKFNFSPERKALMHTLHAHFSQTSSIDLLPPSLVKSLKSKGISTKGWEF